jgi:four helix bundle protein
MGEELEIEVHILTKEFPNDEKYRSVDQLRRSSSSVTNNIAEAYRKQTVKEQTHILRSTVCCEVEETRTNLIRCGKKELCDAARVNKLADRYLELLKATHGYIRYLNQKD